MRAIWIGFAVAVAMGLSIPAASEAAGHRVGGGLEFDAAVGDIDSGFGMYATYEFDLPDPISVMLEINYVGGDFSVESGSGSYTITGIGAAVLFKHTVDEWTGYVGAGGDNNIDSFDNVNYDDKLSLFWMGGARVMVADRLSLEFSLRYRALRIDSIDQEVRPNPLNADAVVFRAGIVYEL